MLDPIEGDFEIVERVVNLFDGDIEIINPDISPLDSTKRQIRARLTFSNELTFAKFKDELDFRTRNEGKIEGFRRIG